MSVEPSVISSLIVTVLPSFIAAASGLGGVVVGAWLTDRRERDLEKKRIAKEIGYLAILINAHLARCITACLQVAYDDGTSEGHPSSNGRISRKNMTSIPLFDPLNLDLDWKILPQNLLQEILELPYKIERLDSGHDDILVYPTPPDVADYFEARQLDFAQLGVAISALAHRLCLHAGMSPKEPTAGDLSTVSRLVERRDQLVEKRRAFGNDALHRAQRPMPAQS